MARLVDVLKERQSSARRNLALAAHLLLDLFKWFQHIDKCAKRSEISLVQNELRVLAFLISWPRVVRGQKLDKAGVLRNHGLGLVQSRPPPRDNSSRWDHSFSAWVLGLGKSQNRLKKKNTKNSSVKNEQKRKITFMTCLNALRALTENERTF